MGLRQPRCQCCLWKQQAHFMRRLRMKQHLAANAGWRGGWQLPEMVTRVTKLCQGRRRCLGRFPEPSMWDQQAAAPTLRWLWRCKLSLLRGHMPRCQQPAAPPARPQAAQRCRRQCRAEGWRQGSPWLPPSPRSSQLRSPPSPWPPARRVHGCRPAHAHSRQWPCGRRRCTLPLLRCCPCQAVRLWKDTRPHQLWRPCSHRSSHQRGQPLPQ